MIRSSHRIRGRIRNIALVREEDPRRWREVSFFLVFLLSLAAPVLFDVTQQTRYVRTRYAIEALRSEMSELDQQYLKLRIERASLESLDLVSQRARRELALVPAEAGARIVVPRPPRPARREGPDAGTAPERIVAFLHAEAGNGWRASGDQRASLGAEERRRSHER